MNDESLNLLAHFADEISKLSESNGGSGKGMLLLLHYMFMVFGEDGSIDETALDDILRVIEERVEEFQIHATDQAKNSIPLSRTIIH